MAKKGRAAGREQVSETIEAIYTASLDETHWPDTLRKVSEVLGGVGAILARGHAPPPRWC